MLGFAYFAIKEEKRKNKGMCGGGNDRQQAVTDRYAATRFISVRHATNTSVDEDSKLR